MSKPRPRINPGAKVAYKDPEYTAWQLKFIKACKKAKLPVLPGVSAIAYHIQLRGLGGQKPDNDNLIGGINDALVLGEYLVDDDYGHLPITPPLVQESIIDKIDLWVVDGTNRKEVEKLLVKYNKIVLGLF